MKHTHLSSIFHISNIFKKAVVGLAAVVMTSSMLSTSVAAADATYKFSDIDLTVTVPEELVALTRSTTNNNSYLEKIGVEDATELRTAMIANDVYLEAINKDVTYEIVVAGKKASAELTNFDVIEDDALNELFTEYVASCDNIENDGVTEHVTNASIYEYNGVKYFQTDVTTVSKTMVTVYSRKYYTIMQENVYTISLQSNGNVLNDVMSEQLLSIVNSASYAPVRGSIFENNIVTELLSTLITIGAPIAILGLLVWLLGRSKKKTAKQIALEEQELRARYAAEEAAKKAAEAEKENK